MKIDDYIRHMELKRKGLKNKYIALYQESLEKGYSLDNPDPNFMSLKETRDKVHELNERLKFLKNFKRELVNNEMQDKKNKQR